MDNFTLFKMRISPRDESIRAAARQTGDNAKAASLSISAVDGTHGVQIFGGTGSGKTSGPMREIALSLLRNGCGGVVLCAKPDEAETWKEYADMSGRSADIVFLSGQKFDFVLHEAERPAAEGGGRTENIMLSIMEIAKLASDERGGNFSSDRFWVDAAKEYLRNAIDLLRFAGEKITLLGIRRLLSSPLKNAEDFEESNPLFQKMVKLKKTGTMESEFTYNYFVKRLPRMSERLKSSIEVTLSAIVDGLTRGDLGKCFAAEALTVYPEDTFTKGKIIVCDYDVKQFDAVGRYANAILKYTFQKAVERRKDKSKFAFLFADEAQSFTTPYDYSFQTTARSSRAITIYATQNLANYKAALGEAQTTSLMGNLQTKILCENFDPETNEWASRLIGQMIIMRKGQSNSSSSSARGDYLATDCEGRFIAGNDKGASRSETFSYNEAKDSLLQPNEFLSLKMGGTDNSCQVEAIIVGPTVPKALFYFALVCFDQECRMKCRHFDAQPGNAPGKPYCCRK